MNHEPESPTPKKSGPGGKRPGAGRKPGTVESQHRNTAQEKLRKLRAIWSEEEIMRVAKDAGDRKLAFDILRYWQDRAEGKPAEQVQLQGPGGGVVKVHITRGA